LRVCLQILFNVGLLSIDSAQLVVDPDFVRLTAKVRKILPIQVSISAQ